MSTKLTIGEFSFVIWAVFEFVESPAVGLVVSKLALIEVTVYKYNLTFWH